MHQKLSYLKSSVQHLEESPTLRINQQSKELAAQGKHIYKLGLGQSPFPVPDSVVNTLRLYAAEKDYLHVQGLPALRDAVANFHRRKDGVDIVADNVLIGPGSKELLFLLQVVFDGPILIPSPSWVSYLPQAKILGNEIHVIHTSAKNKYRIQPKDLIQFCNHHKSKKPYFLILNYPGNPDGLTYTAEELMALTEVCRTHHIYVLSDEIYGQLHHLGMHASIAKFYPEGTIISSGLSKWCGAGGWRLGCFSFPQELKWLLQPMAAVASETYTSVSAPIQYAAVTAFKGSSEIEHYLSHARRILQNLGQKTTDILNTGGIKVNKPEGGFYLWLDFEQHSEKLSKRNINTSTQLCETLLQKCGIAILPGADFNRPPQELTARLSYVDFDGATALTASESIPLHEPLPELFVERYCANVLEAALALTNWLK